jgi:hypothetical protein
MIQSKFASTKKKEKETKQKTHRTSNLLICLLTLEQQKKLQVPSLLSFFIENTKTKRNVCVIFVCALEFQKQSFESVQIVWASGSKT